MSIEVYKEIEVMNVLGVCVYECSEVINNRDPIIFYNNHHINLNLQGLSHGCVLTHIWQTMNSVNNNILA